MMERKRISCKRCRVQKLRCSRAYPCTSCVSAHQECEFRSNDSKKRPASHDYVTALENQVAWLEAFINRLRKASDTERDAMLKSVSFGDHFPSVRSNPRDRIGPTYSYRESLQAGEQGSLLYHGPTSIFQAMLQESSDWEQDPIETSPESNRVSFQPGFPYQDHGLTDRTLIDRALSLFFKWQYPHFMFIYREAFLTDYCLYSHQGKYFSFPLLYALCAIGALTSSDNDVKMKSESFFSSAQEMVMDSSSLAYPHITTVQVLLCLAFYEIGRANHSKGWLLSGMAFRMGHDLGFQCDPKHWKSKDSSIITPEDVEIRRRIYWGCYMSDKFVSLLLGRPTYLHERDAAVESTTPLPDFPEVYAWLSIHDSTPPFPLETDNNGLPNLLRCFKCLVDLSILTHDMLSRVFSREAASSPSSSSPESLMTVVNELNIRLSRWEETLPNDAKWTKWTRYPKHSQPHILTLHILFHSIRICLNREFARSSLSTESAEELTQSVGSLEVCTSSSKKIIYLVKIFRRQYSLQCASLLLVYGIATASEFISMLNRTARSNGSSPNHDSDSDLCFLMQVLEECSHSWKLAAKVKEKLLSFSSRGSAEPFTSKQGDVRVQSIFDQEVDKPLNNSITKDTQVDGTAPNNDDLDDIFAHELDNSLFSSILPQEDWGFQAQDSIFDVEPTYQNFKETNLHQS